MTETKQLDLSQFIGSERYYATNPFVRKLVHTDGCQYFFNEAGAWWFADIISLDIFPLHSEEPFLAITMSVKDGSAVVIATDGNEKELFNKQIDFTDCPEGEYNFYLTDNVLMLTSEY